MSTGTGVGALITVYRIGLSNKDLPSSGRSNTAHEHATHGACLGKPDRHGLKFAFTHAGIEDWTGGLMILARVQADGLIRLRGNPGSSTRRNGMFRDQIRDRGEEIDELKREMNSVE
jgi:hypothetical protein